MPRCRLCSAVNRLLFSSSGTSSLMTRARPACSVAAEYLKENIVWKPTAAVSDSVSSKSRVGLAREPDDHIGREREVRDGLAQSRDQIQVVLARVAPLHRRQDARRTRLHRKVQVPADLRQPCASSAMSRDDTWRGCGLANRIRSMPGTSWTASSSPAKSHAGLVGRLVVVDDLAEQLDLPSPGRGRLARPPPGSLRFGRIRSCPRVKGTTQNAQKSLQPSRMVT